jgi:hypothetical protein
MKHWESTWIAAGRLVHIRVEKRVLLSSFRLKGSELSSCCHCLGLLDIERTERQRKIIITVRLLAQSCSWIYHSWTCAEKCEFGRLDFWEDDRQKSWGAQLCVPILKGVGPWLLAVNMSFKPTLMRLNTVLNYIQSCERSLCTSGSVDIPIIVSVSHSHVAGRLVRALPSR